MVVSQKLIARYAELKAEAPECVLLGSPSAPRPPLPFEKPLTNRLSPGGVQ